MFTRNSRYYALDNIVVNNTNNRQVISKKIRRFSELKGSFQHVVDEGDRLDLLASKYYGQPTKWWRICDANPQFDSPLDLLGKSVLQTVRYRVSDSLIAAPFPWLDLKVLLQPLNGIKKLLCVDRVTGITQQTVTVGPDEVEIDVEVYERYLELVVNTALLPVQTITNTLNTYTIEFNSPEYVGRIGSNITIPPLR